VASIGPYSARRRSRHTPLSLSSALLRHPPHAPATRVAPQPSRWRAARDAWPSAPSLVSSSSPSVLKIEAADGDDARHLLWQRLEHGSGGPCGSLWVVTRPFGLCDSATGAAGFRRRQTGLPSTRIAVAGKQRRGRGFSGPRRLTETRPAPRSSAPPRVASRARARASGLGDAHGARGARPFALGLPGCPGLRRLTWLGFVHGMQLPAWN